MTRVEHRLRRLRIVPRRIETYCCQHPCVQFVLATLIHATRPVTLARLAMKLSTRFALGIGLTHRTGMRQRSTLTGIFAPWISGLENSIGGLESNTPSLSVSLRLYGVLTFLQTREQQLVLHGPPENVDLVASQVDMLHEVKASSEFIWTLLQTSENIKLAAQYARIWTVARQQIINILESRPDLVVA